MSLFKPFSIALIVGLTGVDAVSQAPQSVPFTSDQWVIPEGTTFRTEKHLGQESVYLDGHAYLRNVSFENGTLEVDVAPNTDRGFAGLTFRDTGDGNYEEVYLRMHKSGLPDAMQYNPFYHGESNWQLYPQHQAAEEFRTTSWNHLRLVINGTRMEAYLNGADSPSLVVEHLRHEAQPDGVGIRALFGNHFANFRYTPQEASHSAPAPAAETPSGTITEWQLSPAFTTRQMPMNEYPDVDQLAWKPVTTEANGLLPISRYRQKASRGNFEANTEDVVWVKHTINADQETRQKFYFDYSDRIHVYLNGSPVFAGNNAFRSKGALFRGDIAAEGNALYLDLKKGKNELLVAVAERANGWGLVGRLVDEE